MSLKVGEYGHTAIVRSLKQNDPDTIEAALFEQHDELSYVVGQIIPLTWLRLKKMDSKWFVVEKTDTNGKWTKQEAAGWTSPVVEKKR